MATGRNRKTPFRKKSKSPPPLRFWEPKRPSLDQRLRRLGRKLLPIAVLTLTAAYAVHEYANRPPPVTEEIGEQFTRCGYGRGHGCVVDGDTFKIGQRTIRVVGIDAAELAGECPAEIAQAEASTRALQDWLNSGPFTMTADTRRATDKYGRELVTVTREVDGRQERLDEYMVREGGAQRYDGGTRRGWC